MFRPDALPTDALAYRDLGPFDNASLPAGLLAEHRLKAGTWGLLRVTSGQIDFVWDDGLSPVRRRLNAGDAIVVPPQVPHHLETTTRFELSLTFFRAVSA